MEHLLAMLGRLDEMLRDPMRLRFVKGLPATAIKVDRPLAPRHCACLCAITMRMEQICLPLCLQAIMSSEELRADIEETSK